MSSKVFSVIMGWHAALEQAFAARTDVYIDLANVSEVNDTVLIRPDGSLVTLIKIHGVLSIRNGDDFDAYIDRITEFFSPYLAKQGHDIQFVFRRDRSMLGTLIDNVFRPSRTTIERMGLDWDWILESRKQALERFCYAEDVWMVFETNMAWLTSAMRKAAIKEIKDRAKGRLFAGNCLADIEGVRSVMERHTAAITSIKTEFQSLGVIADALSAREALRDMRAEIDPGMTLPEWTPRLLSDRPAIRSPNYTLPKRNLARSVLPPSLAIQVMPRPARFTDRIEFIRIGSRTIAPIIVTLPPLNVHTFSDFLRIIGGMDDKTPYRVSIRIRGDGLSYFGLKRTLSALFAFASRDLRYIRETLSTVSELTGEGVAGVGLQITCATWVDDQEEPDRNAQIKLLSQRSQMLVQALQAWGQAEATMVTGLPALAALSSVPGVTRQECAPMALAPFPDITPMLPINRQGSPWREGALLLRSGDGKVLPFQPGSTLQPSWSTIGFAPPGSGKSVLLSTLLIASILSPGRDSIPFIGIIDIGISSRGLIDLLRASLPDGRKHLAVYEKLANSREYCINPFDTPLGTDHPTPSHKAMLVDFVSTLCTPDGDSSPPMGVVNLVSEAIGMVYDRYARKGDSERRYDSTRDPAIAAFVESTGILYDSHTTWWEIVDALFEAGHIEQAAWAQRYAVPTLGDFAVLVNSDARIQAKFAGLVGETQQRIIEYVYEFVTAAIGRYPMLSDATRFTLDTARVVSLNLEAVAPSGSAAAKKQSAIMYLLARHAIMARTRIEDEILDIVPDAYRPYYLERIKLIGPEAKIVCYDEFHRTSGIEGIRTQIERDIREGRKYNTQVLIFSQDHNDFSDIMVEFSTTQFILGSGGDKMSGTHRGESIAARFGLSPTDLHTLDRLRGPTAQGAMAFMIAKTKDGVCKMLVYNTIGAPERWALETNALNRALRDRVIERLGLRAGLDLLSRRFPTGSAAEEIEQYAMKTYGGIDDDESVDDIVDHFAKEILSLA